MVITAREFLIINKITVGVRERGLKDERKLLQGRKKNVTACSKVGCQCLVDILGQRD